MKYCQSCILPDTRPNLRIGDDGVCNAYKTHATKPTIDWESRERQFRGVVANALANSRGYDCLVPVSGGKDSTWQIVQCLHYGLKPLAVTWKTPARTAIGVQNLANLVSLGVDHIDFQINPKVEARFMLEAFIRYGSTAIPMHMAIFNIPLKIAVQFEIPLIIWGENSAFEYGSTDEARMGFELDAAWLKTYGVTHGTTAEDWVSDTLTRRDLTPYFGPTPQQLERSGTLAIFMGYYFEWDPQMTVQVAQAHGFQVNPDGARLGYYDYADIDDDFISIHHWLKWYKFGFTRLFDNLSLEIRNGRLSRQRAVEIVVECGDQTPYADIERFCAFVEITPARFFEIAETFRNHAIWQHENGIWKMQDFLIPDWSWA